MLFSLFRVIGWICVVAILVLSLVPGNERPYTGPTVQFDHVIAYCGTAGLLGLGYPTTKVRFEIFAMLAVLAAVLEVAQLWVPGRHSQFIEFAMSCGGACLGMSVVAFVDRIGLTCPCGVFRHRR